MRYPLIVGVRFILPCRGQMYRALLEHLTEQILQLLASSTNGGTLGAGFQLTTRGRRRTSRATILTNAPEVNRHQQIRRQWEQDDMSHVETDQCRLRYT